MSRSSMIPSLHCLAVLLLVASVAPADNNWPQFRGADSRGIADNPALPDTWSATENVEWKTDLPGRGWSSPIVWGDRIFLTTVVNDGETPEPKKGLYFGGDQSEPPQSNHSWKVLCLDLNSGDVLWNKTVHEGTPDSPIHIKNSYASETPVTDGERVYCYFGNVGVFCFDFDGNELWKHLTGTRKTRYGWGPAASPVLHDNRLYIANDNDDSSYLLALDAVSGNEIWHKDRDEKSNWATPFIWQNDIRTEIITPGTGQVRSYDLDGNLLWWLEGMSSITIATPYEHNGLLYVTSGYVMDKLKPIYAIRPGATGDITLKDDETSSKYIAWCERRVAPYNPSTLIYDNRMYVLYDMGIFTSLNPQDGSEVYGKQRLRDGKAFTASPWAYNGRVFCLNENGLTFVIKAGGEFELLHTNPLAEDDMCMATPAITGDRLLIRTDRRLYCIRDETKTAEFLPPLPRRKHAIVKSPASRERSSTSALGGMPAGRVRVKSVARAVPTVFKPDTDAIREFRIDINDTVLTDLSERLARTRWPDQIPNSGWQYGVDVGYMKELVQYWRNEYDWKQHEAVLNRFPQFKTEIDGIDLHFLHVKSPHKEATPLIVLHGWPGSFCEFQKVIPMLTEPEKHGGKPEDAFHVVCPSLPGFGYSSAPREPGWNVQRMAEVMAKLMARLGYDKYGAQGGDWGAAMVGWLATNDGAHCIGVHTNFPMAGPPSRKAKATDEELQRMKRRQEELSDHMAYGQIQGTRPLTLAYALHDSPVGLASWIVDKFWAWSDHGGDLESSFTKDELLTNIMIYWVTDSMPSAVRIYYESGHPHPRPKSMTPFERSEAAAPIGFAVFPKELSVPPRSWVENFAGRRLLHWQEMPKGGHFAAMEQPDLLAADVREFFAKVRQRTAADNETR